MALKDIRPLKVLNTTTQQEEIFYPATTTDAVVHPTTRKSSTEMIDSKADKTLIASYIKKSSVTAGSGWTANVNDFAVTDFSAGDEISYILLDTNGCIDKYNVINTVAHDIFDGKPNVFDKTPNILYHGTLSNVIINDNKNFGFYTTAGNALKSGSVTLLLSHDDDSILRALAAMDSKIPSLDTMPTNGNTNSAVSSDGIAKTVNTEVYTKEYKLNLLIRKLFIDTSGYTGSKSLTGLKISLIANGILNLWGIRIQNSNGDSIGDFWDNNTFPNKSIVVNGIFLYAEYCWSNWFNGSQKNWTPAIGELANECYDVKNDPRKNNQGNVLCGKTLVCCGDSITYGAQLDEVEGGIVTGAPEIEAWKSDNSGNLSRFTGNIPKCYGYQIACRNKMKFYNCGVSGSTMQDVSGKNGFSKANGRYTKLPDQIDYLTILFGWNDAAYGTLGTISDSTNASYYGGYNVVLPYLINKYPYTKIALIVPFGTTQGHRDAVRQLANKYGLACFDMYQAGTPLYYGKESSVGVQSSIVTANIAKFQVSSGAHPNLQGHTQISNMLEHFLRGI